MKGRDDHELRPLHAAKAHESSGVVAQGILGGLAGMDSTCPRRRDVTLAHSAHRRVGCRRGRAFREPARHDEESMPLLGARFSECLARSSAFSTCMAFTTGRRRCRELGACARHFGRRERRAIAWSSTAITSSTTRIKFGSNSTCLIFPPDVASPGGVTLMYLGAREEGGRPLGRPPSRSLLDVECSPLAGRVRVGWLREPRETPRRTARGARSASAGDSPPPAASRTLAPSEIDAPMLRSPFGPFRTSWFHAVMPAPCDVTPRSSPRTLHGLARPTRLAPAAKAPRGSPEVAGCRGWRRGSCPSMPRATRWAPSLGT